MIKSILSIVGGLLKIILIIFKKRNTPEAAKERRQHERDKEIAEKDHPAKGKRLSNLMDDTE